MEFEEVKSYLTKPHILLPFIRNKVMKLYISTSDSMIGSMLAQEDENNIERAIYYLSQILNDVENRYNAI